MSDAKDILDILRRVSAVEERIAHIAKDPLWEGTKDIADALRVSLATVARWSEQERDPLPLNRDPSGRVSIKESALRAWASRHSLPCSTARELEALRNECAELRKRLAAHEARLTGGLAGSAPQG